jgi:hypothetical protein
MDFMAYSSYSFRVRNAHTAYKTVCLGLLFYPSQSLSGPRLLILTVQGRSTSSLFEQQTKSHWFLLCIDNISPATSPSNCIVRSLRMSDIDKYLDGTWEEFEQWIRFTIGSDFVWRIRPLDRQSTRQMVAYTVRADIEKHNGVFPAHNSFIERKQQEKTNGESD